MRYRYEEGSREREKENTQGRKSELIKKRTNKEAYTLNINNIKTELRGLSFY